MKQAQVINEYLLLIDSWSDIANLARAPASGSL